MDNKFWLERTSLLIGADRINHLEKCHVIVVGLGGVGSFAVEFLARAGIGKFTIVDGDFVDITNINRQLQALHSTIGQSKALLMKYRIIDINPLAEVKAYEKFLDPEDMIDMVSNTKPDFILDCIDSITPKLTLIAMAKKHRIKIISSMGAGGKQDPSKVRVADLWDTRECKFAQTVKKRLKRMGMKSSLPVVYGEEIQPKEALKMTDGTLFKRSFYGTISFMPALFGLHMASEVIRRLSTNTSK